MGGNASTEADKAPAAATDAATEAQPETKPTTEEPAAAKKEEKAEVKKVEKKDELRAKFNEIDTDKSGMLDKEEIRKALKDLKRSDEHIEDTISKMKKDEMDFEEFKLVAAEETKEDGESKPKGKAKAKGKGKSEGKGNDGKGKGKEGKGKSDGKAKGESKGKTEAKGKDLYSGPMGGGEGYRLNVKNLAESTTGEQLTELFKEFGTVVTAVVKKRDDGKSRGFGFVTMTNEEEGLKASEMNGKEIDGKAISVSPAERRPAEEKPGDDAKGKGKGAKGKGGKADALYAYLQQQQQQAAYMHQYMMFQQHAAYLHQQQMAQAMNKSGGSKDAAQLSYMQTNYGMMPYVADTDTKASVTVGEKDSKEYEGSLKSLSGRNGYGFIVCSEAHAKYGRDVYIDKDTLPDNSKVAARLKFTVELNAKGHPKASSAKLVPI